MATAVAPAPKRIYTIGQSRLSDHHEQSFELRSRTIIDQLQTGSGVAKRGILIAGTNIRNMASIAVPVHKASDLSWSVSELERELNQTLRHDYHVASPLGDARDVCTQKNLSETSFFPLDASWWKGAIPSPLASLYVYLPLLVSARICCFILDTSLRQRQRQCQLEHKHIYL